METVQFNEKDCVIPLTEGSLESWTVEAVRDAESLSVTVRTR